MQTGNLLFHLADVLTPKEFEFLHEYQTPQHAWRQSNDPDWMIRILSLPEFAEHDHRNLVRLGIRLLEKTPIDHNRCAVYLITRKSLCDIVQVLNLYAEAYADWSLVTNNDVPRKLNRIVENMEQKHPDRAAHLEVARILWHITQPEPDVEQMVAAGLRAVNAFTLCDPVSFGRAYHSLASTIRMIYPELPVDILCRTRSLLTDGVKEDAVNTERPSIPPFYEGPCYEGPCYEDNTRQTTNPIL